MERFEGRRVRSRTGVLRRTRSFVGLLVVGLVLAILLAAAVSVAVGGIAVAIRHIAKG